MWKCENVKMWKYPVPDPIPNWRLATLVLATLAIFSHLSFAAPSAPAASHNIAFRRAVYQSSATDYTHVGHLATDGKGSDAPLYRPVAKSEFPGKSPDAETPQMAIDGNKDTKWLVFEPKCWLEVALPAPARAASYAIMSANDDPKRDPQKWRVLGSNDGVTFEEVAAAENPGFGKRHERKSWKIDKPGTYRFYRLAIDANGGAIAENKPCTQLAEFDLLDDAGSSIFHRPSTGFQSRWVSKTGANEWLKVDLGAPSRVDAVKVAWTKGGEAEESHVELSSDGKSWTRGTSGKDVRFVKLVCEKAKGAVFGVDEIEVMGDNALKVAETGWRLAPARDVQATGEELSKGGYDDSAWLPAVVPGTVVTSYLKAGAIPDMNIADNQLMISDGFFYDDFWYRHAFTVPKDRKGQRVWLNFDAINWKAEVYVNGTRVGDIKGGFIRGRFDVTKLVKYGGENRLAVKIIKNATPGEVTVQSWFDPGPNGGVLGTDNPTIHASIGWDWIPTVRGRNIGIYRDVHLSYSGDVWLSDGWVVTDFDVNTVGIARRAIREDGDGVRGAPALPKAEATVRVRAHNASEKPVKATLEAALSDGGKVSSEVELAAGETREVTVGKVTMENPKLWWPVTYGEQPLYGAAISAKVGGKASDAQAFKFGVRKFTFSEGKPLKVYCNGTRIVCRGGNWGMDDANLAATPFDYDTKVRLHAEANFTMIRNWVGMVNSDDFYKACDKYGILVWDDFWLANPADGPNPADPAMFIENAKDKVLKNRHHASIPLYCARNEGYPPPSLSDVLPQIVKDLDGTRHYIPNSLRDTVSGGGPYTVLSPKWYFEKAPDTLHSERGQPNIPEIESMRKMLGPDHLWPIDDVWGMHDYTERGAQYCRGFTAYVRYSYGAPKYLEEFTRFAQAVAYENHKAMFESVYVKGCSGILMWMSQSAWPSMVWQTYDYWHDVNGGYYGSKVGNQAENVILDQSTMKFWAINATAKPLKTTAKVAFYDTTGKELLVKTADVALEADSKCELFQLPELAPENGILLIRATIANSENFTWINVNKDRDYKAIVPLLKGKAKVENVKMSTAKQGVTGEATVVNNTKAPLLLIRLKLVDENGERVLPVHWSENYISLMPGESRVVKFDAPAAKGKVSVVGFAADFARVGPFENVVRGTSAGDVKIYCKDTGGWKFDVKNSSADGVDEIVVRLEASEDIRPPTFEVSFSFPQIRMNHLWTDFATDGGRLKPDWAGWKSSDISHGQPLACLHDGNNRNRLTMSCSEALRKVEWRMALREENCMVVGGFRFFTAQEEPMKNYEVRIRFDGRDVFWSDAVQKSAAWIAKTAGLPPCHVPDAAFDPLYSSWYSFHQNVFAKDIEEECAIAAKMGMKTIILDDGWQTDDTNRGYAFCGDWKVSPRRFPDMAAHVKRVHELGMKYMVWYAVPFVGQKSANLERFKGKYLCDAGNKSVLDPRFPEVRKFLVDTYVAAMKEWGLDGFKLDFIDSFWFRGKDPAVADNYAGRDIRSLPEAVNRLMTDVYAALTAEKPDVLIEFRQSYIGPAIRQFGNMMRAGDCPGDMQLNRLRIANLRMTVGGAAVHADMLEWHPTDTPERAALPILSSMFGVIQYSMMLRELPESHREVIRHWLAFSQVHRDTLMKGHFRAYHPEAQYPLLEAESASERLVGVYTSGTVVPCGKLDRPVYVLNGTGVDGIILDLPATPKTLTVFDAIGKTRLCEVPPSSGLARIAVPSGGYARVE